MTEIYNYSIIGLAVSAILIIVDFYLLRKRRLQGRGFVLWFIVGAVLGLFSAIPALFTLISVLFGTQNIVNAINAAGLLFFLLFFFYVYIRLSEMHTLLMKLAMEVSVKKYNDSEQEENEKTERRKSVIHENE